MELLPEIYSIPKLLIIVIIFAIYNAPCLSKRRDAVQASWPTMSYKDLSTKISFRMSFEEMCCLGGTSPVMLRFMFVSAKMAFNIALTECELFPGYYCFDTIQVELHLKT